MGKISLTSKTSRVVAVLLLTAAALVIGITNTQGSNNKVPYANGSGKKKQVPQAVPPWFAPYVDVTLGTVPQLQNPSHRVVLSFIIAGHKGCTPTWGGTSTLDQAGSLNASIAQARAAGMQVLISFGGQQGPELAVSCRNATKLENAYRAVVNRYKLNMIDLDIEGPASLAPSVNARRAQAIAALQKAKPLSVWLTLGVDPTGLDPKELATVQRMQAAGVKLAGVNVMTFDYGPLNGQTVLSASEKALIVTARQLQRSHISKFGATIMEGYTDSVGQVWSTADAKAFYAFALAHHLMRLSEWSLNRDQPCSGAQAQPSDYCSGVSQSPQEFSDIL